MRNESYELGFEREQRRLRRWFVKRGLDLEVVPLRKGQDPEIQWWQLRHLRDWVEAWEELGDREGLEHLGFCFPPLGVGLDPEADWKRFERWIARRANPGRGEDDEEGRKGNEDDGRASAR